MCYVNNRRQQNTSGVNAGGSNCPIDGAHLVDRVEVLENLLHIVLEIKISKS